MIKKMLRLILHMILVTLFVTVSLSQTTCTNSNQKNAIQCVYVGQNQKLYKVTIMESPPQCNSNDNEACREALNQCNNNNNGVQCSYMGCWEIHQ